MMAWMDLAGDALAAVRLLLGRRDRIWKHVLSIEEQDTAHEGYKQAH